MNADKYSANQICSNLREKHLRQSAINKSAPICVKYITMTENEISFIIRGAIFKVYNAIGPGLLESAYESALTYELKKSGLSVQTQVGLPFTYEDISLDIGYRIDILVENRVIIEVKSVEALAPVHFKQLLTYLKLSNKRLGILVNFNTDTIANSIERIANKL